METKSVVNRKRLHVDVSARSGELINLRGIPVSVKHNCYRTAMLSVVLESAHPVVSLHGMPENKIEHLTRGVLAMTSTLQDGPATEDIMAAVALLESCIERKTQAGMSCEEYIRGVVTVRGFFNDDEVFILAGVSAGDFCISLMPTSREEDC